MKNFIVSVSIGLLTAGLSSANSFAQASTLQSAIDFSGRSVKLAQADESKLVAENRALLLSNRELARKIASKLELNSTGEVPTSSSPLEQNQVLILQNQETFKAIAGKLGVTVPALPKPAGADVAEQNHNLLLQNRTIVVAIAEKLGVTLSPPPELTGSFVAKNHTLLLGNKASLEKIAAKLGVQ
jgi:hypothetical protein